MNVKAKGAGVRAPASTIETKIWSDRKFVKLSRPAPCAQVLFLYLLAGPHTAHHRAIPGVYRIGRAQLADEMGWAPGDLDTCCAEIAAQKMAFFDWDNRLVWLVNALKHHMPRSPDNVRAWHENWILIPDCALKRRIFLSARSLICVKNSAFEESFQFALTPVTLGSARGVKGRVKNNLRVDAYLNPCGDAYLNPCGDASLKPKPQKSPKMSPEMLTKVNASPSGIRAHGGNGFKTLVKPKTLNLKPKPQGNPLDNVAPATLNAHAPARVYGGNGTAPKAPPDKADNPLQEFASVRRLNAMLKQGDLLEEDARKAASEKAEASPSRAAKPNPEPAEPKPRGRPRKAASDKTHSTEAGPTWEAYTDAFLARYHVDPVRNAIVNSQMLRFVERIGRAESPAVARFYVEHNSGHYVRRSHAIGDLLHDAEALRTQWATHQPITATQAAMADRTATNANAFAPLIAEAKAREQSEVQHGD